jgi:hypothetical protein
MLGVKINYEEAATFLKEQPIEWVAMPFQGYEAELSRMRADRQNGVIRLYDENYTVEEIDALSKEKEGVISEFRFGPGPNEGYFLMIRTWSGQIIEVKTFERDVFERFLEWIKAKDKETALRRRVQSG